MEKEEIWRKRKMLHTHDKGGNKLRKSNDQEIHICKEFELFVENDGKEGDEIIFLISYNVG